jgi:hypothetical protein
MMSTQVYDDRRAGWLEFAAVTMLAVGFFRIISAIAYFADSHKINELSNGLFSGHTWAWGLWDLLIASVAILAGLSILGGGRFGRIVGYIWAVLVIVQGFATIGLAPWYAAAALTIGFLVIYALASTPREVLP